MYYACSVISNNKMQAPHIMSADTGSELQDAAAPPDVHILYHTDIVTLSTLYTTETYVFANTKCQ